MGSTGRRETKKGQTRAALESAAWRLFERDGYDETTIDRIAETAGVSPRTFFRYYDSKEAVLLGDWRDDLERLLGELQARPADEPLHEAIAEAMRSFSDDYEERRITHLHRARITAASERAGLYQRTVVQPAWEESLRAAICARLGGDTDGDLRSRTWAAVTVAVSISTVAYWLERGGVDPLPELVATAFEQLIVDPDETSHRAARADADPTPAP